MNGDSEIRVNETLVVIPARFASKEVPGKMLRTIAGKRLLDYTIDYVAEHGLLNSSVVVTDDERIEEVAKQRGVSVVRDRKDSNPRDGAIPAIKHAVDSVAGSKSSLITILQPTQPLRPANLVADACKKLQESEADGCLSVMPPLTHPDLMLRYTSNHALEWYASPGIRQDMEPLWSISGSVYVVKKESLLTRCRTSASFYQELNWVAVEHENFPWVDIDSEKDIDRFEAMMLWRYASCG